MTTLPSGTLPCAPQSAAEGVAVGLRDCIRDLLDYCCREQWSGWDPYDGLNSRLFQCTPLIRFALARLAWTQFFKRCPVNLRPLAGVPRGQNPKGIALFMSALVRLERIGLVGAEEVEPLAARLVELRSPGRAWSCWGYHFDWQTRGYIVPRFTPNVVCTTFAGHALLDCYDAFQNELWFEAARSAGAFLLEGLNVTRAGNTICFSYTPLDHGLVHNANLLAAAFLARLHSYRASKGVQEACVAATRYAIEHQRPDGSWPYGEGAKQQWIDSFHTGYNLCALEGIRECMSWEELRGPIERGYRFYLDHFFEPDGWVKYFHDRTYPIDSHAIAHALVTLTTLASYDPRSVLVAAKVCDWALRNMRSPEGWFYYQKWPLWTNRINYMRWSQAWMLLGLAEYAKKLAGV